MTTRIFRCDIAQRPARSAARGCGESGFSLVELMIAIAVLGILLSLAVPNFNEMINRTRVGTQAEELVMAFALARSEAATRGLRAVVCVTTDGATCVTAATAWERGRLVFVDSNADGVAQAAEIIKIEQALRGDTTIAATGFASAFAITYGPYGGLVPATSGTFKLCSAASAVGRQVAIAATGRATSTRVACP